MLHSMFAFTLDRTIHINDIVNTALTAVMIALGHGLRRVYMSVKSYFAHIEQMGGQIEQTAGVVDSHSIVLKRAGLAADIEMPKLSRQRRQEDRNVTIS